MSHVTNEEVGLFFSGRLSAADLRRVLHHLVSGCPRCRARLKGSEVTSDSSSRDDVSIYDGAVERAYEKALEMAPHWKREQRRLTELLTSLQRNPDLNDFLLDLGNNLNGWALVEALITMSHEARFREPRDMLKYALAARVAAGNLDSHHYSPRLIADLQARASAELGNAYRVNDNFEAAESALTEAFRLVEEGTGDPLVVARIMDLQASLRSAQRRLPEAIEILDHVHELYECLDEHHLAGRALISKGINVHYFGSAKEAVILLQEGRALLEPSRDSRLEAVALQSLIHALADSGEFREARRLIPESGLRQKLISDPINLLKLRGIEAKVYAGLGKLWRAASILLEVRERLQDRGLEYEAALVGLELLGVWLQDSRTQGVGELAREILTVFEKLKVEREALRAVRFLNEACRREEASAALVQRVIHFLRRLEWEPRLQFAT